MHLIEVFLLRLLEMRALSVAVVVTLPSVYSFPLALPYDDCK